MDVVAERCVVPAMERMSRRDPGRAEMMSPLDRLRNSTDDIQLVFTDELLMLFNCHKNYRRRHVGKRC